MSIDVAYSTEIQEYIDPEKAYELYWAEVISDKRAFLCPGTSCQAQTTCCNIDKDRLDQKVVPHFRVYGKDHSDLCEVFNGKPLIYDYEDPKSSRSPNSIKTESITDQFLLERPASYYDKREDDKPRKNKGKVKKSIGKRSVVEEREIGSTGKLYSVRSVVTRYARYKKENRLQDRKLNVKGQDVYYSSLFKCIWEQNIDELPERPSIYYGWAYIDRLPSDYGYRVKFKKPLIVDGEETSCTIMVSDRLIEDYPIKKLVSTRLKKAIKESNSSAFVFVYGKPERNQGKNAMYANINITNLDYIDISQDSPLQAGT